MAKNEPPVDPRLLAWPRLGDFPVTEPGINAFLNAWVARRRRAGGVGGIPVFAIDENRQANRLMVENGWRVLDGEECSAGRRDPSDDLTNLRERTFQLAVDEGMQSQAFMDSADELMQRELQALRRAKGG